ncbi:hypothetical protein KIPB_002109 [Kipferlia bialata]|uniref:Uncharacterized protein n=1 Tax=Kipferlia bialata TaxID=797122 RepID=A0A9K3CQ14_9EUKA|nr:hypothetical protein KIPB_002109 [Kipferlia bialata]|eukprot:g2109.t1
MRRAVFVLCVLAALACVCAGSATELCSDPTTCVIDSAVDVSEAVTATSASVTISASISAASLTVSATTLTVSAGVDLITPLSGSVLVSIGTGGSVDIDSDTFIRSGAFYLVDSDGAVSASVQGLSSKTVSFNVYCASASGSVSILGPETPISNQTAQAISASGTSVTYTLPVSVSGALTLSASASLSASLTDVSAASVSLSRGSDTVSVTALTEATACTYSLTATGVSGDCSTLTATSLSASSSLDVSLVQRGELYITTGDLSLTGEAVTLTLVNTSSSTVDVLEIGGKLMVVAGNGLDLEAEGVTVKVSSSTTSAALVDGSALTVSMDSALTVRVGRSGCLDGSIRHALFSHPSSVCVLGDGTLAVADTGNNLIRLITLPTERDRSLSLSRSTYDSDGSGVSTLAGFRAGGSRDGSCKGEAGFMCPVQVECGWVEGSLLVLDQGNGCIRMIDADHRSVSTLATGLTSPGGMAVSGDSVFVSDKGVHNIKVVARSGLPESFSTRPSLSLNASASRPLTMSPASSGRVRDVMQQGEGERERGVVQGGRPILHSVPVSMAMPVSMSASMPARHMQDMRGAEAEAEREGEGEGEREVLAVQTQVLERDMLDAESPVEASLSVSPEAAEWEGVVPEPQSAALNPQRMSPPSPHAVQIRAVSAGHSQASLSLSLSQPYPVSMSVRGSDRHTLPQDTTGGAFPSHVSPLSHSVSVPRSGAPAHTHTRHPAATAARRPTPPAPAPASLSLSPNRQASTGVALHTVVTLFRTLLYTEDAERSLTLLALSVLPTTAMDANEVERERERVAPGAVQEREAVEYLRALLRSRLLSLSPSLYRAPRPLVMQENLRPSPLSPSSDVRTGIPSHTAQYAAVHEVVGKDLPSYLRVLSRVAPSHTAVSLRMTDNEAVSMPLYCLGALSQAASAFNTAEASPSAAPADTAPVRVFVNEGAYQDGLAAGTAHTVRVHFDVHSLPAFSPSFPLSVSARSVHGVSAQPVTAYIDETSASVEGDRVEVVHSLSLPLSLPSASDPNTPFRSVPLQALPSVLGAYSDVEAAWYKAELSLSMTDAIQRHVLSPRTVSVYVAVPRSLDAVYQLRTTAQREAEPYSEYQSGLQNIAKFCSPLCL